MRDHQQDGAAAPGPVAPELANHDVVEVAPLETRVALREVLGPEKRTPGGNPASVDSYETYTGIIGHDHADRKAFRHLRSMGVLLASGLYSLSSVGDLLTRLGTPHELPGNHHAVALPEHITWGQA